MKQIKCQYCSKKGNKDDMCLDTHITKSGNTVNKYYHKKCLHLKNCRDRAINIFYEYTKSLEPKQKLYTVLKQIKEKGIDEEGILYTMQYIEDNKCVLNYPHGILYYLDNAIKEYKKYQSRKKDEKRNVAKSKEDVTIISNSIIKNTTNDELDISDFF